MSSLWGFGYLVHAACYKHSAPLGLNAATQQNSRHGIHRRGLVSSPDGLGNPTPTDSMVCDNTTLRSSGARGLDVSRCYRHIAPLERKAATQQNSRHGIHRRGLVSSPDGLGNPTPTHPIWPRVFNPVHPLILSILIQTNRTCRPSGAKCTNAPKFKTRPPS